MSEQDEQVLEAINSNDEIEIDLTQDDTEDVEALRNQVAEKDAFARQAVARAKKAEAELKALKGEAQSKPTQNINSNVLSAEDVDIKILKAAGKPQDEIDYLKKLAQVNGTGIVEAQSDGLYKSWVAQKEADSRAEKARLGASRGAGSVKEERSTTTPDLSDKDHKELWRQMNA